MLGRIELPQSTNHRFDLTKVLDGTQDFRWKPLGDWYSGVLKGHIVHLRQIDSALEYRAHTNLDCLLTSYFRLHEDIDSVFAYLSRLDPHMASLIKCYPHFRLLRQPDPWECTVAYICSATNSVRRIKQEIVEIAVLLGRQVPLNWRTISATHSRPRAILEADERLQAPALGFTQKAQDRWAARRLRPRLDFHRSDPKCSTVDAKTESERHRP